MAQKKTVSILRDELKSMLGKEGYKKLITFSDKRANGYRLKVCFNREVFTEENVPEVLKRMANNHGLYMAVTYGWCGRYGQIPYVAFLVPFE